MRLLLYTREIHSLARYQNVRYEKMRNDGGQIGEIANLGLRAVSFINTLTLLVSHRLNFILYYCVCTLTAGS